MDQVPQGWAGVDVGKGHHWVCLTGEDGTTLWSSKVINDESAILDAIGEVCARAEQVTWAVDVTGTMSGLLLALLAAHNQAVKYVPGRVANKMADTYRGEGKTDARDAYVIAETVRQRGDLTEVEVAATLVTELRLLVTHRTDLVADRVRLVNRLRDSLSGYFPALERAFDYAHSRGARACQEFCVSHSRRLAPPPRRMKMGLGPSLGVTNWNPGRRSGHPFVQQSGH